MNDDSIEVKARQTGFCQRNSKLPPRLFLEMLLCKCFSADVESLTDHTIDLRLHRGLAIKKQSLHNKFSSKAVAFIQALLSEQMFNKFSLTAAYLDKFPSIQIQDSTRFGLPSSLESSYSGYGGRGAKAGGKIQFVYDLRAHQFSYYSLDRMTENDLLASKNNHWISEGALILRDLGYYSHEGFQEIVQKKAFYISKVKPKTVLFDLDGNRFDLVKQLNKMKRAGITTIEKELVVGWEKNFKSRVIISRMPDEVREKRLRDVSRKASNRHYTTQKEYKAWAGVNVLITNVDQNCLTYEQVLDTYRLRWQIELVFKTWKSHYKIDKYKTMKKERMECYVYGTLLLILLQWRIFSWLNYNAIRSGFSLSLHKFSKLMIHLNELFNDSVVRDKISLGVFIDQLNIFVRSHLIKEKKKHKIGFIDIVNKHGGVILQWQAGSPAVAAS